MLLDKDGTYSSHAINLPPKNSSAECDRRVSLRQYPLSPVRGQRAGIHPLCITTHRKAKEYLPHMYGHAHYMPIDDVKRLPLKVAASTSG